MEQLLLKLNNRSWNFYYSTSSRKTTWCTLQKKSLSLPPFCRWTKVWNELMRVIQEEVNPNFVGCVFCFVVCEIHKPSERAIELDKRHLFSLDPSVMLVQWVKMEDLAPKKDAALAVWWDRHDGGSPELDWRGHLSCNVSCPIPFSLYMLYISWVNLMKLRNGLTIKLRKSEFFPVG